MSREIEAVTHLLRHLDGVQVLPEATLGRDLDYLAAWASLAGEAIRYDKIRALRTLSLVVQL